MTPWHDLHSGGTSKQLAHANIYTLLTLLSKQCYDNMNKKTASELSLPAPLPTNCRRGSVAHKSCQLAMHCVHGCGIMETSQL
jgi:hypothetical protein